MKTSFSVPDKQLAIIVDTALHLVDVPHKTTVHANGDTEFHVLTRMLNGLASTLEDAWQTSITFREG